MVSHMVSPQFLLLFVKLKLVKKYTFTYFTRNQFSLFIIPYKAMISAYFASEHHVYSESNIFIL